MYKQNYLDKYLAFFVSILVVIGVIGFLCARLGEKTVYAQGLEEKTSELETTNTFLKDQVEYFKHPTVDDKTQQLVEFYINKYFGKDATRAEKVFTCESGLNPERTHVNKPGLGTDSGVAQINDKTWKPIFERVMNEPFDIGSHDIQDNIKFAKYIFDRSNSFQDWVCNSLV